MARTVPKTLAACAALLLFAQGANAGDTRAKPRAGVYRYVEGAAGRRRLTREIARVADDMFFLIRGIARRRLRAANPIARRLELERRGAVVTLRFDGRVYRARLGGKANIVVGTTGDKLAYTVRQTRAGLVQRFVGAKGTRINKIKSAGADRIVLDVTIMSARLPSHVRYHLVYQRVR